MAMHDKKVIKHPIHIQDKVFGSDGKTGKSVNYSMKDVLGNIYSTSEKLIGFYEPCERNAYRIMIPFEFTGLDSYQVTHNLNIKTYINISYLNNNNGTSNLIQILKNIDVINGLNGVGISVDSSSINFGVDGLSSKNESGYIIIEYTKNNVIAGNFCADDIKDTDIDLSALGNRCIVYNNSTPNTCGEETPEIKLIHVLLGLEKKACENSLLSNSVNGLNKKCISIEALEDGSFLTKTVLQSLINQVCTNINSLNTIKKDILEIKKSIDTSSVDIKCLNTITADNSIVNLFQRLISKECSSTVNIPPVAIISNVNNVSLPEPFITLEGVDSYDSDGTIVNFTWEQITNPILQGNFTNPSLNGDTIQFQNLEEGTYTFKLTVEDNYGDTHSITKDVIVTNDNVAIPIMIEISPANCGSGWNTSINVWVLALPSDIPNTVIKQGVQLFTDNNLTIPFDGQSGSYQTFLYRGIQPYPQIGNISFEVNQTGLVYNDTPCY